MDILNYLHSISISITLDNVLIVTIGIIIIVLAVLGIYKIIRKIYRKNIKVVNMNISIAKIGTVCIEVNKDISKIAHKAWIEIMTRKVGLIFEEDKDVIVEVYNSWYSLFGIIRELLKDIEPRKKDVNMEKLEEILIKTLNEGLRPHLTKWQTKFRKWYEYETGKNENISPQEIQRKYDQYNELVDDLKNTNKQMVEFARELKKLI